MKKLSFILGVLLLGALIAPFSFAQEAPDLSGYESRAMTEEGLSYNVEANYPEVTGFISDKEKRDRVNAEIKKFVASLYEEDLNKFKEHSKEFTAEELDQIFGRDSVYIDFEIRTLNDKYISVLFNKLQYWIGAWRAHTDLIGFNYDFIAERQINLADFFETDSDYLNQISELCIADLTKQLGDFVWKEGAGPKLENLKEFTIKEDQLFIAFSQNQVGSTASGAQEVTIPFKDLRGLKKDW